MSKEHEHEEEKQQSKGPQDDKKFFTGSGWKKEEDKKKRVTIPLPDMDFAVYKEASSPDESEKQAVEQAAIKKEEPKEMKKVVTKRGVFTPTLIIYILGIFLVSSLFASAFLFFNMQELKKRAALGEQAVQGIVGEKEKIAAERKTFEKEIDRLRKEIASSGSQYGDTERERASLRKKLAESALEYEKLENKLKESNKAFSELVNEKSGYYDAYMQEKGNVDDLSSGIEKLVKEKKELNALLASIDETYREKEALYLYDLAFLSLQTGMTDEAVEYFERFTDISAQGAAAYYNLGVIYERIKEDDDKAVIHYQKYLDLDPKATDLYKVKSKIRSLKRRSRKDKRPMQPFKIDLGSLKY